MPATLFALFVSRHLLPQINSYTVVYLLNYLLNYLMNYNPTGISPYSSPRSTFQYLQLQPPQPSTYCTQRRFVHGLDPRGYYLALQPRQYGQNLLISGSDNQLIGRCRDFCCVFNDLRYIYQSMGTLITGRSAKGSAEG